MPHTKRMRGLDRAAIKAGDEAKQVQHSLTAFDLGQKRVFDCSPTLARSTRERTNLEPHSAPLPSGVCHRG